MMRYLYLLFFLLVSNYLFAAPPTISSFSPAAGSVGTLVTITGANLGNPTAFIIGGQAAVIVSNNGTQLVGMVMPGASTGMISVTTADGSATGSGNFSVNSTVYPSQQQGPKLTVPTTYRLGFSVALSADGNTAIAGAQGDNNLVGAAYVFIRNGSGLWNLQGKLVGTGSVGMSHQGVSVSISADGNTAAVGAPNDDSAKGAVWVYTRTAGVWTQQGNKLVGTGATGVYANHGNAVALSADGNTLIEGGPIDNNGIGATWVFTRSAGTWTQQGNKLVGTGSVVSPQQGSSVALSADGNTAAIGGIADNTNQGAIWVYTRSGSTWTQQGSKLVGTGSVNTGGTGAGGTQQGTSIAISADGNTIIEGGFNDTPSINLNPGQGATWVFVRSGGTWTQQGPKLVGTGNTEPAEQGVAVALSADGNTAMIGGDTDNGNLGAIWYFTRNAGTWTQQGTKLSGIGYVKIASAGPRQGMSVALSANGNTAVTGGAADSVSKGAVWVFTAPNAPPTITSFSSAVGITGAAITITGTNFFNASAVSFGGVASTSFTVNSATSITAIVGAGASGSIAVTTPGGTATIAGFNYLFALPPANFKITTASAACRGSSTGSVKITAAQHLNYTATITGNSLNTPYTFTDSVSIPNLAAGTYNVCITVAGQSNYQQCFTVVVTEPKDLSVFVANVSIGNQVVLTLGGGTTYHVNLNGTVITTTSNQLTLSLAKGTNIILVSTDTACQGVIEKDITVANEMPVYPNPFDQMLNLNIGSSIVKKIDINIYSTDGRTVYTTKYNNASGSLQLDLAKLNSGMYLLRLSADDSETVFKIVKK